MAKKFGVKPTLTATCEKCPGGNLVLFEDTQGKYCEKCYADLDQKLKQAKGAQDLPVDQSQEGQREFQQEAKTPSSKQEQVVELQGKLQSLLNVL